MTRNKKITIGIICLFIIILFIISMVLILIHNKITNHTTDVENQLDTTFPIIVLDDVYVVKTGYSKKLVDVIMSADDMDPNPTREILGEYDLNISGEYPLTYKIQDSSGNVTTKDFTLKVKDDYIYQEKSISFQEAVTKYKNDTTKLGIDVSKWQGEIDWKQVAGEGVEFAIIRIAYQNGFDGDVLIDPYFEKNVTGCMEQHIPIAVYFSSYAQSKEEAQQQANWVCETLTQNNYINLNIAFDWENWSSFNKLGISLIDINDMADLFMETCVNQGYRSMLYGSKTYLESVWKNEKNYPIWLANYVEKTNYENSYKIWQFCQTGTIQGISGNVDINVMYE